METEKGWICLHRKFLDWEWYDDANTMRLFIHCLLLANHRNKKWRGKTIKRGTFITSQSKLANSLSLTIMQIRNSLRKLKTSGEITVNSTAEYSVITLNNYNVYQEDNRLKNTQTTQNEQTSNRRATTTNNDNNIDTNSYINISSSSSIELTKEDEELLKSHSKRNKIKYFKPWLRKILGNGDYKELLEKEKRLQAKEEKQKKEVEVIEEVETPEDREKIKQIQEQIKQRSKRR